jgi:hypothetical protein
VLTAVEDFVEATPGLQLAVVPSFFGLGVVWPTDAPYAQQLAELLGPFDRNPLIGRLEANRAFHLASVHQLMMELASARARIARQEGLLQRLLTSSAFALAERMSKLRVRAGIAPGSAVVSRDEVRRALEQNGV